mmetsp:Transcript_20530/g.30726  ORF Transcript_20530/g.30726 Transcript_20530/m.30726 type:complete len:86 (+) Transcript_20530:3279-3536(+)
MKFCIVSVSPSVFDNRMERILTISWILLKNSMQRILEELSDYARTTVDWYTIGDSDRRSVGNAQGYSQRLLAFQFGTRLSSTITI